MNQFRWILSAAISAYACHLAVHHATPIDRALPLLAVAVTFCAAVSYPAVLLGVPLLVGVSIIEPDDRVRLLAYGAVIAAAFAVALAHRQQSDDAHAPFIARQRRRSWSTLGMTVSAIVLLRWIPFADVQLGRELFLLGACAAIVFVLKRTPFAIAIAVLTALFTPAVPLRTLAIPLLVLVVAMAARAFGMPRFELVWPSAMVLAFALLFFAWSGVVARAPGYFLKRASLDVHRHQVAVALAPRESLELDVPEHAASLIVSGANVAHLRRGAVLGRIDAAGHDPIDVRIGDAADWGAMRREQAYGSRNPAPRNPAGRIRGFGYNAWVDGAGRVALPPGARFIRVTGADSLPAGASLQVEGFE
ncbi:MAG TPA: hypothetical protein VE010_22995 [Thermoanaerobaculia bacterium]|nr:hypothetical protein [Thermoanaerobaculia bacterium]